MQEVSLDGVIYASLRHNDQTWLLGSTNPAWKELVGTLPASPSEEAFRQLAAQGIWLNPAGQAGKLAVMCCGLGSGWPGMGQDLYDNFPQARKAMDYLASLAGWDILGLMDETELEIISQTRKQIPYLYMLEYAQWMQFLSLGISPAIICGHSLGELIALCLAGVYDEKAAWLLFEKRAEHITNIENKSANETGMLAVHAEENIIEQTLAQWPSLALANRNTSRQFILGGPKKDLLAARRSLRKQKIPAMLINVPLAFHNPAMRVLRDFSIRRLKALEMHPPRIPVLSNVTTGFYPAEQEEICRYIADLDENAVAWNECALSMWNRDGIRTFLELGPAETLCGLMSEIIPQSTNIACDHRLRETSTMRMACARLFSLGLLDFEKIIAEKASRPGSVSQLINEPKEPLQPATPMPVDAEIQKILEILAKSCEPKSGNITLDMDLRYDLGIRSSSFPLLLQEVEKELSINAEFESLLNVSTVGDLALALLGRKKQAVIHPHSRLARAYNPPFRRFMLKKGNLLSAHSSLLNYSPEPKILPHKNEVILFCAHDNQFIPQIWSGFAAEDCILVVPKNLLEKFSTQFGCRVESYDLPKNAEEYSYLPELIFNRFKRLDGILFIPSAYPVKDREHGIHHLSASFMENLEYINSTAWIAVIRRFEVKDEGPRNFLADYSAWLNSVPNYFNNPNRHIFAVVDDGKTIPADEIGDFTALELMYGTEPAFWCRAPLFEGAGPIPQLFADAKYFPQALPEHNPELPAKAGLFQGISWWSAFTDLFTITYCESVEDFSSFSNAFNVPASRQLMAMLQGAKRLHPWLVPLGFSDIYFYASPKMPFGIARECRMECRSMFWIRHEKIMTRMVEAQLMPRMLSADGRRLDEYETSARGICLLGCNAVHTLPIFSGTVEHINEEFDPEQFYELYAIPSSIKLIKKIGLINSNRSFCGLLNPCKTFIAMGEKWDYHINLLQMFDSVIQASQMALSFPLLSGSLPVQWKCAGVGYLNFDCNAFSVTDDLCFYLEPAWRADKSMRFNAQVGDSAGRIFLVAYNLEFDRA